MLHKAKCGSTIPAVSNPLSVFCVCQTETLEGVLWDAEKEHPKHRWEEDLQSECAEKCAEIHSGKTKCIQYYARPFPDLCCIRQMFVNLAKTCLYRFISTIHDYYWTMKPPLFWSQGVIWARVLGTRGGTFLVKKKGNKAFSFVCERDSSSHNFTERQGHRSNTELHGQDGTVFGPLCCILNHQKQIHYLEGFCSSPWITPVSSHHL